MSDLSVVIDANGATAPTFPEILGVPGGTTGLIPAFEAIYGSDTYLGTDSQDYEFLSLLASKINDSNQAVVAAYNSFPPTFAQGAGLSAMVKINGIRRQAPTQSTAEVHLVGQEGTAVVNGAVRDSSGNMWDLPALVTIGVGGVDATATARELGAIRAAAGALNVIATPTRGWQSVTNAADAIPGAPVETDAALRRRQALSVASPAEAIVESIASAVANVDGVTRSRVYENDTAVTDSDGIPGHSIAVVTGGGDGDDIAEAIFLRKPPGIQTFGSTSRVVTDSRGIPLTINFSVLDLVPMTVEVDIDAFSGYVATTGALIQQAVALFLNELDIGEDSYLFDLVAPASLSGQAAVDATGLTQLQLDALKTTFTVVEIRQARDADPPATANVVIDFDEAAEVADAEAQVTITVV